MYANENHEGLQQLIVLPQQGGSGKAGYLVFHPERRRLLPTVQKLFWNRLENITRFSAAIFKNFIFILGGYNTRKRKIQRTVIRYDLENSTWYYCNKMRIARADFCAIINDGRIYCAGGVTTGNQIIGDCESYEPYSNAWFEENPLPFPCCQYAIIQLSMGLVIIGGLLRTPNGSKKCSNYFWYFSKQKSNSRYIDYDMQWISIECARFPSSRGVRCHCLTLDSIQKRVYLVGGTNDLPAPDGVDSNHNLKGLYYFDIAELEIVMQESSKLSEASASFWRKRYVKQCQRVGAAACVISNKLMVIGGVLVPKEQNQILDEVSATQMVDKLSTSTYNSDNDSYDEIDNSSGSTDTITASIIDSITKPKDSNKQKAIWKSLNSINISATKSMRVAEKQLNYNYVVQQNDNANITIDIHQTTNLMKSTTFLSKDRNLELIDSENSKKYEMRLSTKGDIIILNEISGELPQCDKDVKLDTSNHNIHEATDDEILPRDENYSEKYHVSNVGYYDTLRKAWIPMFGLDDELLDSRSIVCLPLELKHHNRDMRKDRFNWLVQWALW